MVVASDSSTKDLNLIEHKLTNKRPIPSTSKGTPSLEVAQHLALGAPHTAPSRPVALQAQGEG
jgi:hypothetical protein